MFILESVIFVELFSIISLAVSGFPKKSKEDPARCHLAGGDCAAMVLALQG